MIGQVRRERLVELQKELGVSFAEMNFRLGRSRRDSTLSQIVNQAPNSRTGKLRQMGDDQARELEKVFDKSAGWFDRDPEMDVLAGRITALHAAEPSGLYEIWPFAKISKERFFRLPAEERERIELMVEGQVVFLESKTQQPPSAAAAA